MCSCQKHHKEKAFSLCFMAWKTSQITQVKTPEKVSKGKHAECVCFRLHEAASVPEPEHGAKGEASLLSQKKSKYRLRTAKFKRRERQAGS